MKQSSMFTAAVCIQLSRPVQESVFPSCRRVKSAGWDVEVVDGRVVRQTFTPETGVCVPSQTNICCLCVFCVSLS